MSGSGTCTSHSLYFTMSRVDAEKVAELEENPSLIRNICILAHVDHGIREVVGERMEMMEREREREKKKKKKRERERVCVCVCMWE